MENDTEIKHLMDVIYHDANISQQEENDVDDDTEPPETIIDLSDLQNDHFYTKNVSLLLIKLVLIGFSSR